MSPYRVLMVCTGNICRSPAAEGILRHMLAEEGLATQIEVDSAGTTAYHQGEPPSRLGVIAAKKRGYHFEDIRSRPLRPDDFSEFDLILAMDHGHFAQLKERCPSGGAAEIALFLSMSPGAEREDVPDPYYGGDAEYEYALDLIERGCRDWVTFLRERPAAP